MMNIKVSCLSAVVVGVVFSQMVALTAGQANCQNAFLNRFVQCVTNSSLNSQNFLWLSRDGQMGTKPQDLPAFTQQACLKEEELGRCFQKVIDQYAASAGCSDADKNAIEQFSKNVVINLDNKCAHPCRSELLLGLADCLTEAGVDGSLLLSNVTTARHGMLGDTQDDVNIFCQKREDILQCMSTKTDMCPEAPDILTSAGLDVEALNATILLLCDNRQLYLNGARCSANRSQAEERCRDLLVQEVGDLNNLFQARNIERDVYTTDLCRVRLDNIRCDLNALGARGDDSKCPDVVVGLRREQECSLLTPDCRAKFAARVTDSCDPIRFLRDKRRLTAEAGASNSNDGGRTSVQLSVLIQAVALSLSALVSPFL